MPGSVSSAGIVFAIAFLAVGFGSVSAAAVHGQRLSGAADGAALAAADAASGAIAGSPCERAAEVAATAGAEVTACEVDGLVATVSVSARFGMVPVFATARAGPPPSPP